MTDSDISDVGPIRKGISKLTPTQLTLRYYREQGYICDVVEYYNAYAERRHDMFNFADIAAVNDHELLLIQTTTKANISARRRKMQGIEAVRLLSRLPGIRVLIVGWAKKRGRWEPTIERYNDERTIV